MRWKSCNKKEQHLISSCDVRSAWNWYYKFLTMLFHRIIDEENHFFFSRLKILNRFIRECSKMSLLTWMDQNLSTPWNELFPSADKNISLKTFSFQTFSLKIPVYSRNLSLNFTLSAWEKRENYSYKISSWRRNKIFRSRLITFQVKTRENRLPHQKERNIK